MVRYATCVGVLAGLICILNGAAFAEPAARHARKPVHAARPAPAAPSVSGNINAPSTDFSKVERADDDATGPDRGGMRPVMGAGGIGLGGGF